MKAVILAAGRGERMRPMGWDKPKCLLEFGGRTLLDLIISAVVDNGIDRIVVVVGYMKELVAEAAMKHSVAVDLVCNPDFSTTNTINSLYLARDYLNEDFLYFNADVLFDRRIVMELLACDDSAMAVEQKLCGAEEVKVIVDDDGRILRISKALKPEECLGEFIGIAKFNEGICESLVQSLKDYNETRRQRNMFFEAAVDAILDRHVMVASCIGKMTAAEIDSPDDYDLARQLWDDSISKYAPGG